MKFPKCPYNLQEPAKKKSEATTIQKKTFTNNMPPFLGHMLAFHCLGMILLIIQLMFTFICINMDNIKL